MADVESVVTEPAQVKDIKPTPLTVTYTLMGEKEHKEGWSFVEPSWSVYQGANIVAVFFTEIEALQFATALAESTGVVAEKL